MKIGIIGTRGIPNEYGGFEQFATDFSVYATSKGHDVTVYCSSLHTYKEKEYNGVKRITCHDPESYLGIPGQFFYDLLSILDARKQGYDFILQLGYTSSSIWNFLLPKNSLICTNMDGMEWKRSKYSLPVQRFLRYAESLAIKHSDIIIADSPPIKDYLTTKYGNEIHYIPYATKNAPIVREEFLEEFGLRKNEYAILIARMEPENNVHTIIKGYLESNYMHPLLVVGNTNNAYGKKLLNQFRDKVVFTQGIYNQEKLNTLRSNAAYYFHGHMVGGTNPSLLEAMLSGVLICAHDNPFNKYVLGNNALYFKSEKYITNVLNQGVTDIEAKINGNLLRLKQEYSPELVYGKILNLLKP